MGTWHSHQRYVPGSAQVCEVRESQYGSWTKLSLVDCDPVVQPVPEIQPRPPEDTNYFQFLTRPPSEQQDFAIREVAEKLLDAEGDVSRTAEHLGQQGVAAQQQEAQPQTKPQTKQREAALHYSLRIYSLKSSSREAENKETIAKALVEHFESLVEQVKPVEVADKLYGIGVLEECDLKRASCSGEVLMQQVKRALWKNPGWFVDICKVLRACGVKAISQVIEDVQRKCPTEEVSLLSSGSAASTPIASKPSPLRNRSSCHEVLVKLEESFTEGGLPSASEYIRQLGDQEPLLHEACLAGVEVSTLDLLLNILAEKDLDINSKNVCGQTPLHLACAGLRSSADSEALDYTVEQRLKIEHLLSHKASNWIKDKDGNTPLHLAVLRGDLDSVSMLLSYGKRCLNSVNKKGNSALHLACRLGLVDIVKTLCGHKADASLQNKKRKTALHLACIHEHNTVALVLASHDQSTLDAFDHHRMTALHLTCKRGNNLLAISLLQLKNCTPNRVDEDDKTPLHYACTFGSADLAGALLEKNSSQTFVDARDKFGDTALHIASRHGHRDVVKELLAHRANKEVVNQEGKTAMDIAIEGEHNSIATKMLRKRGWNQRRKTLRRVRKLRRTLTSASLTSSTCQSEMSEITENSSEESGEDETLAGDTHTYTTVWK